MNDPFGLERFVAGQDQGRTYAAALAELRAGRKHGHWMWFVFPQLAGLGRSPTAARYAISSLVEARAYLDHPVLGPRLLDCAQTLIELPPRPASEILGSVDAIKLRSSMTPFAHAAPSNQVFRQVLDIYFGGIADDATERLLGVGDRTP